MTSTLASQIRNCHYHCLHELYWETYWDYDMNCNVKWRKCNLNTYKIHKQLYLVGDTWGCEMVLFLLKFEKRCSFFFSQNIFINVGIWEEPDKIRHSWSFNAPGNLKADWKDYVMTWAEKDWLIGSSHCILWKQCLSVIADSSYAKGNSGIIEKQHA